MVLAFWPVCCIALASMTALAASPEDARNDNEPETHVITVENMEFSPPTLAVKQGDRVVWVNRDLFPHTATADSNEFDSGEIGPEASWTYVAVERGEFDYICSYHPTMKGKITVR